MKSQRTEYAKSRSAKPKCYCRYAILRKGTPIIECIRPPMKGRNFCKRHGTAGT